MPAIVDQTPNDLKTNFMTILGKLIRTKEPDVVVDDQTQKLQVCAIKLIKYLYHYFYAVLQHIISSLIDTECEYRYYKLQVK